MDSNAKKNIIVPNYHHKTIILAVEDLFCRKASLKDGLRGKEGAYAEMRIELLP
jgi:hypothetical protein